MDKDFLNDSFLKDLTEALQQDIPVFASTSNRQYFGFYVEAFGADKVRQLALCICKVSENTLFIVNSTDLTHCIGIVFNDGWNKNLGKVIPETKGVYISHIHNNKYFKSSGQNPIKMPFATDAKTVADYIKRIVNASKQLGLYDYIVKPAVARCYSQCSYIDFYRRSGQGRPEINSEIYEINRWLRKHNPQEIDFGVLNANLQKQLNAKGQTKQTA